MERTTDQAVEATFLSILNTLQASFFYSELIRSVKISRLPVSARSDSSD
jgi:hypothetical protein